MGVARLLGGNPAKITYLVIYGPEFIDVQFIINLR